MKPAASILNVVLLILAGLFWLAMMASAATMNESDAAGRGMAYGFAFISAIGLWILLAVLMLIAGNRGGTPGWLKIAALILVPLSFAAALATISVLNGRGNQVSGWPIVVPAVIPLLVSSYIIWRLSPSLRAAVSPVIMERGAWGLILVLSLIPWPLLLAKNRRDAVIQASYEAKAKAEEDSAAQSLESKFKSLTPGTPLRDWLAFATAGNDMRERTLQGIRALPNRQAQAEALTGEDLANLMYELRNLGLEATPALCRSANEFLASHAGSFRQKAATTARYEIEASAVERYLFAMQWLASNHCDITPAIDAYDGVVRVFPAATDREKFLARLRSLRPPRP